MMIKDGLFMALLILLPLLIVLIPFVVTYFSYNYLRRKYPERYYKYFAFIPILLLGYVLYDAIFPDSDFYKADYKEVTRLDFPKEAKFIHKEATFPDQFGDYTSVFLFETTPEAFKALEDQLTALNFNQVQDEASFSPLITPVLSKTNRNLVKQYVHQKYANKRFYVGLFDDAKTILVCRDSW